MARIALITPHFLNRPEERMCLEAKGHQISDDSDLNRAMGRLLGDPPDLAIIEKGLPQDLDQGIIQTLKNNLQLALLPILLVVSERDYSVGINWNLYPVDDIILSKASMDEIVTRVSLALFRTRRVADNNPLTKLPGNSSILKTIQDVLDSGKERAVGYVDIDHFKPYNDKYGFSRGDEVIRMVARVLVNVVQEEAGDQGFVGHIGGDDFVFLVPMTVADQVCQRIIENFSVLMPLFLDEDDLERGCFVGEDRHGQKQTFGLTSLSLAVVPCPKGRFAHYGEVAQVAVQIKKKVKSLPGNQYLIDRRQS